VTTSASEMTEAEEAMQQAIAARVAEGKRLHPWYGEVLQGGIDSTAADTEHASARLRTLESALGLLTIEPLLIALTPIGMLALTLACLQHLSGEHGELPDGLTLEQLDPWCELTPFQRRVGPFGAFSEECGRAGWHLERVTTAMGL
jgi:hypothetical protein